MKKIILAVLLWSCLLFSGCYTSEKITENLEPAYSSLFNDVVVSLNSHHSSVSSHIDIGYNKDDGKGQIVIKLVSGADITLSLFTDENSVTKFNLSYVINVNGYNTDVAYLNVPSEDRKVICDVVNSISRAELAASRLDNAIELSADTVDKIKRNDTQNPVYEKTHYLPNVFIQNIAINHKICILNPQTSTFSEYIDVSGEIK